MSGEDGARGGDPARRRATPWSVRPRPPTGGPAGSGVREGRAGGVEAAVVDCALYRDGVRHGARVPLAEAREATAAGGFVWIGLYEPDMAGLGAVADEFGLHPLAVEDAVHAHQRPKLEAYDGMLFVVLKTVRYVDPAEVIETGEIMVFLGADFVVTVRHGLAGPLTAVRRTLEADPELLALGPSVVLYAVADHVVDDYGPVIDQLAVDVDHAEMQLFDPAQPQPTERLYHLKREVLEFRRAVAPLAAPLAQLAAGYVPLVDRRVTPYFRDVHDHLLRAAERVAGFDELLTDAVHGNLAQLTVRQNEDMRKIAAWVAILALNTVIAGIYGMNFEHMPELKWVFGYPLVLGVMATVSILVYLGFRRSRWL